jgi:hypothetical protein
VLQGSFVIHNSLDVASIASFAQISGRLEIDAPGLTAISLPSLCSVGADLDAQNAQDLVTLDLPALRSVGGTFGVLNGPLQTVHLDELATVGDFGITLAGALDLPSLDSVGDFAVWGTPSQVNVPNLTLANMFSIVCTSPCGPVAADALASANQIVISGARLSAGSLTTAAALILNPGAAEVDAPALTTITGEFWLKSDPAETFPSLATVGGDFTLVTSAPSMSFPALVSIGGGFTLATPAPSLGFPALVSIGGDVQVAGTGTGQVFSFPALMALDGKLFGSSISLTGSFDAPLVATAKLGLKIENVSSLNLSGLQSVGLADPAHPCGQTTTGWANPLELNGVTLTTVQLPALQSACLTLGQDGSCGSGNLSLTSIAAPNLFLGGVEFYNNPSLPVCRADALAAQFANPVVPPVQYCPLAAGPCP